MRVVSHSWPAPRKRPSLDPNRGESWHLNLNFYFEGARCHKCQKCHFGTFCKNFRFWGAIEIYFEKCQKCHSGTFWKNFRFWGAIWHFFKKFRILGCQVPKVPEWHFLENFCSLSRCQKSQKCLRANPRVTSKLPQVPKVPRRHFSRNHPILRKLSAKSASSPHAAWFRPINDQFDIFAG